MSLKNIVYLLIALAGVYFGFKILGIVGKLLFWGAIIGAGYVGYRVISGVEENKKINK